MSLKSLKENLGFLLAGIILVGVAANVYLEFKNTGSKTECLYLSTL